MEKPLLNFDPAESLDPDPDPELLAMLVVLVSSKIFLSSSSCSLNKLTLSSKLDLFSGLSRCNLKA